MKIYLVISVFILFSLAAITNDKMEKVPGYGDFNTSVYAGYLNVGNDTRQLHYVFVQSVSGANNKDPVTLWLNGGPGCSSLLGFIQEIGPYFLEDGKDYKQGDNLTFNEYSWHKASNLLFLETPAGVGFSYNTDTKYKNNDLNTAHDNYNALLDFFKNFTQYSSNNFFIAGESYAGKYIPDLAVLIDNGNMDPKSIKINLKGILVGNGIMDFRNSQLQKSQIKFMMDKNFMDPELVSYWQNSCHKDPQSAGCSYFYQQFEEDVSALNPYNVYGYCFYNSSMNTINPNIQSQSQALRIRLKQQFPSLYGRNLILNKRLNSGKKYNGNAPCAYFDGMYNYFNKNADAFHPKWKGMLWNGPCAENITYQLDLSGSMASYRKLLGRISHYSITLYNGDWDDVVPYIDTLKNLERLNLQPSHTYTPWFTDGQHSGFSQHWSGIAYITVKGASHQVPQAKRKESLQMFKNIISGHGQR